MAAVRGSTGARGEESERERKERERERRGPGRSEAKTGWRHPRRERKEKFPRAAAPRTMPSCSWVTHIARPFRLCSQRNKTKMEPHKVTHGDPFGHGLTPFFFFRPLHKFPLPPLKPTVKTLFSPPAFNTLAHKHNGPPRRLPRHHGPRCRLGPRW